MLQGLRISRSVVQGASFHRHARYLSVKELSWCAPTGSPTSRSQPLTEHEQPLPPEKETSRLQPIGQFGVVAAISACKKRVIGINGQLPWSAPEDRRIFKSLTHDSILIIGRNTLEEHRALGHIDHASHCIVISESLSSLEEYTTRDGIPGDLQLSLATSFTEALHMARELEEAHEAGENDRSDGDISCWVAGGEQLYGEALHHESLKELRLSWVQIDIPLTLREDAIVYARFPPKYFWDNRFKEISKTFHPATNDSPAFEHCIYKSK
ncbi:MAG: hypothetical protein SGBAC_002270 [Bacillariaceae sp.]